MQSEIIAMLVPEASLSATMLIRRANGQFALERIDARVAVASRLAARWSRKDRSTKDATPPVSGLETSEMPAARII
jgi:hypothetical protein